MKAAEKKLQGQDRGEASRCSHLQKVIREREERGGGIMDLRQQLEAEEGAWQMISEKLNRVNLFLQSSRLSQTA